MIGLLRDPAPRQGRSNPWSPLLALVLLLVPAGFAQDTPLLTVDEECSALAYAPDGRIAYAVRRILTTKRLEIERDDIWLIGTDGKRHRIVNGEKLIQGPRYAGVVPFSYAIQSLRWAPDGKRLTAEMLTSEMIDARGNTQEGLLTLLLDETGKEIKIAGADSAIPGASNAAWLADGVTVVYLEEAVKPKLLYSIHSVRPVAGRGGNLFPEHAVVAAAWNARQNAGVAIERDRSLSSPPRLVALDLIKETRREMATLDGYAGGLSLSPSGTKVAYFRDYQVLEIRDMNSPERAARIRVAYGTYEWAPDEQHLLLKRALEHRSGDLVWVSVPALVASPAKPAGFAPEKVSDADLQPVLHGLSFRDFALSPDGRSVGVIQPGKRNLLVYPLK